MFMDRLGSPGPPHETTRAPCGTVEEMPQKGRISISVAILTVALLYSSYWIFLAGQGTFLPVDFNAFYTGAKIVADGNGKHLYDLTTQSTYQLSILGRLPLNGNVLPFVNPPHFAAALVPLAWLSVETAYLVWMILQVPLILALLVQCWSLSQGASRHERLLLTAGIISLPMLLITVYKGQLSLMVLLCWLLWAKAFKSGSDCRMAGWLLIGSFKPQFLVLPLLILLLARKWKALILFALGLGLCCIGAVIIVDPSSLANFFRAVRIIDSDLKPGLTYPQFMYNFKGALSLIPSAQPNLVTVLSRVAFIVSLLVTILLWKGKPDGNERLFDLKLALTALLSVFFTLHLYYYDSLLLIAPALFFYSHLKHREQKRPRLVFLTAILLCPLLFLESSYFALGQTVAVRGPVVLIICWFVWMAALLGRETHPHNIPIRE